MTEVWKPAAFVGGGGGVSGAAAASPVRHPPPPPTERALIKAASRGFAPDDLDLVPRSPVRPPQVVAEQARWLGLGLGLGLGLVSKNMAGTN